MVDASARDYKEVLVEALQMFRCWLDPDVQDFINTKAIDFEKRGWATTYLVLNEDDFENGKLHIEGYFSLSHKAVLFDDVVSITTRKKISGTKKADIHPFVLIGQLGKNITKNEDGTFSYSEISSKDLLDDALSIIQQSSEFIVNRNIIIECKSIEKVQKIYSNYGFVELQFDGELHTMYLRLDHSIDF